MNNYKLISDEKALRAFIDWLPELLPTERYYLTLMVRRKYAIDRKFPDITLRKIVCQKEDIFDNVKKLEIPLETYVLRSGDIVPQEVLALYININPRSMVVAARNTAKAIIDLACGNEKAKLTPDAIDLTDTLLKIIDKDTENKEAQRSIKLANNLIDLICKDKQIKKSPRSVALTEIHKARGTKHFVDIDIDNPKLTLEIAIKLTEEILNRDAFSVVKTRGGVHIVIESKKANTKTWFRGLAARFEIDVKGDCMLPMPGGYQGGHVPIFSASHNKKNEI